MDTVIILVSDEKWLLVKNYLWFLFQIYIIFPLENYTYQSMNQPGCETSKSTTTGVA